MLNNIEEHHGGLFPFPINQQAIIPELFPSMHRYTADMWQESPREQFRVYAIHQHTTDKSPMGFTETKYFPVHTDYNTLIKK